MAIITPPPLAPAPSFQVDDESLEGLSYRNARLLLRQAEGLVELMVLRREKKALDVDDDDSNDDDTEQLPPLPSTPLPNDDN